MDRVSEIIAGWRERCAWLELQAEDLEARRKVLTCDGKDVTALQARNLRQLIANMRDIIAWRDRPRARRPSLPALRGRTPRGGASKSSPLPLPAKPRGRGD